MRAARPALPALLPLLAASALGLSCTLIEPAHELPGVSVDGLIFHETGQPGAMYVRPDHHIGGYDQLRLLPLVITYERSSRPLSERREARLEEHLTAALREGARAAGVELSDEASPCVLDMQIYLVDLDLEETRGRSATSFVSTFGDVTMVYELRDSETGAALVRYAQRRSIPGGNVVGSDPATNMQRLGKTLDKMLADFNRSFQANVPLTTQGREGVACKGLLFEAAAKQQASR